jgi:trimeric autotransporter adhesin
LQAVTTDAMGNLASDGGAFQRQIDGLGRRDRELADGIAIAVALQQPIFHNGQTFAGRIGYGNFDGSNAFGLSLAGVISKGSFGPTSSVTLDGGVGFGTATNTTTAKAGITFGW